MGLVTFFLELSGFIFLAFALFWSVISTMFHKKLDIPLPAALALGFVLQAIGLALMLLISFARKSEKASLGNLVAPADPFAQSTGMISDSFAGTHEVPHEYSLHSPRRGLDPSKIPPLVLTLLGLVLFISSVPLTWFYSFAADGSETSVGIFSSGLEVWLLFTVLAAVAALVLSVKNWSMLSPLLIAYFSAWWSALSLAALTNRMAFIDAMSAVFQLPNVIVTSGIGELSQIVNQRVGEAWLVTLPASIFLLSASYYMAYRYATSAEAEKANFF